MVETIDLNQLGQKLAGKVRQKLEPYMGLIYLKIVMDVYNSLVELTPVDTGYLKLSLTTELNGEATFVPEPREKGAKSGQYVAEAEENVERQLAELAKFKVGDLIGIGYTASYSIYVEDMYHMVKTTRARLNSIARKAFAEAKKGLRQ